MGEGGKEGGERRVLCLEIVPESHKHSCYILKARMSLGSTTL